MLHPIQVAYRGFEHGLTLDWIYEHINRAIEEKALDRPVHVLPPGDRWIPIHFGLSLIETWRFHYDRGDRIDIPRKLWSEIDRLLGVKDDASGSG